MGERYAHFMCNRKIRHGSFSETHVLLSNTLANYSATVPVRWAVATNAIRREVMLLISTFEMLQGNLCYILAGLIYALRQQSRKCTMACPPNQMYCYQTFRILNLALVGSILMGHSSVKFFWCPCGSVSFSGYRNYLCTR